MLHFPRRLCDFFQRACDAVDVSGACFGGGSCDDVAPYGSCGGGRFLVY